MVRISFHLSCFKHEPFGTHRSSLLLRKMLFDHVLVTALLHLLWRLQSFPHCLAGTRNPSYPAPLSTAASWFTLHPKCLGPSGLHVTAAKSQDLHFTLMALHTDFNQTLSSLSSTISFMTHSTTFSSQLSPSSRSLLCVYISGHSLLKLLFF